MENKESNFVSIIKEICETEEIELTPFSDSWVFELRKGEKRSFLFGYQFGLNSAVTASVCNDKATAYEVLHSHGIPSVPHYCYMSPSEMKYVGMNGCFVEITNLLERYGSLVVKNNEGTGGMQVYRAGTRVELEHILLTLFPSVRSIAVSPYVEIEDEYRVVVLDGEVQIIFSKQRTYVEGDGVKPLRQLMAEAIAEGRIGSTGECVLAGAAGERVLEAGEHYYLSWRHNLGLGAKAKIEDNLFFEEELTTLARSAAEAVGARFASVDIVCIRENGEPKFQVLEINSGVMMENLAGTSKTIYDRVRQIYTRAIRKMLKEGE